MSSLTGFVAKVTSITAAWLNQVDQFAILGPPIVTNTADDTLTLGNGMVLADTTAGPIGSARNIERSPKS